LFKSSFLSLFKYFCEKVAIFSNYEKGFFQKLMFLLISIPSLKLSFVLGKKTELLLFNFLLFFPKEDKEIFL